MNHRRNLVLALVGAAALAACDDPQGSLDPARAVQAADAVVLWKSSLLTADEVPMATFYGFVDDYDVCDEVRRYLEREEPNRYRCGTDNR